MRLVVRGKGSASPGVLTKRTKPASGPRTDIHLVVVKAPSALCSLVKDFYRAWDAGDTYTDLIHLFKNYKAVT